MLNIFLSMLKQLLLTLKLWLITLKVFSDNVYLTFTRETALASICLESKHLLLYLFSQDVAG
jgi:hypothetical protein